MKDTILRTKIELPSWNRQHHFEFYQTYPDPMFNICFSLEVTKAKAYALNQNYSLFLVLLYLSNSACNNTQAFKRRIDEQHKPYLLSEVHPSATILNEDETFNFCDFIYTDDISQFITDAEQAIKQAKQTQPLSKVKNQDFQIFYSVIPWLHFTGYKHAQSNQCRDIPKIVFGKISEDSDKAMMPVSVEMNHALADGIDVAKYQQNFEKLIANLIT